MRIHTRIMGAALVVAAALCVTFLTYSLKKEQDTAHAQLHATMEQTRQLLQATIAGPLYDGNIAQLNAHLDSFFKNPDLVEIYLSEYGGDIRLSRAREVAGSDANRLRSVTPIPRGLDQIGEIQTVFTTARIEQRLADSRNQMLLFTAALLAGLAIVIYVAARSLTRPIDRLTEAARAMSAGDLERHIDPGNTQELVVLGESFARMRDVIREKIADLAAKNRLLNQEVDERMRAQEELQRAYGENRAVTQAVHDNLFMTNPAGELVWWNRRVEETTGQSAEQLRGQPGVCFFHEDDREAVGRALMQAAATGFAKVEARLLTASGVVEYQFNGVRVLDERGQLVGIAGSGRDISERVRGERVLRENEAKYRALADNIPQRVFYKDRQSRYLAVNHHYAHDLGLNPEDFIGKDDHALHPTDIAARYQRDDQRVMDTGQALEADESYVRGGNEFMIHTVKTPVWDETGAVIGVCGIFFDVTEQRVLERRLQDSEATLRAIYENAPDGILVSSIDADRIWMANPGICRMTGYSEAELLALRPLDLHPAHVGAQVARAFSSLREGTFSPGKDLLMQRKDGSTFFADVSPAPVTVRGQPCFIAIFRDVTERRLVADAMRHLNEDLEARVQRRTEQLALSRDEAKRANEAKSAFLSRMSHELRTPLNAILGFAQLLVRDKLPVEQADNAREIVHAGRHLLDLINEVLDLARIESGKFTVSLEPLPLLPLLEDCMALIRPQADARAISMTVRSPDRRQQVQADRTRLKQVLLNLLSNAVKYNRQGGAVHVHCVSEEDTLQIRVTDTGTGLSAEQQLRLFVPFERLDAERTAVEGAGIGLALSKRLVEHMQGQIGVQSAPGAGSTFWVRLPLSGRQAEVSGPTPLAADDGMRWPVPARKQDVLCIEDNPANLRLIERILARDQGIHLLTASQPGLGLELARAHQPAMILLDINLPDMDGYAVMQCLRESPLTRDIPVVAISANAMPSDLERGRAAGFVDYLTKPLDIEHLMAVTHRILDIDRESDMTRPDSPATTDQRSSSSSSSSSSTVPPYFEPSVLFLKLAIGCLIAGSLGFLLVIYTMAPDQVGRAVGPVVMFLLALVAWFLLARGRTKACVTTLVLGIWMVAAGVSVFNGGVRTPIVITYPLIIMMAGWLLGARMAITLAVLTVAINLTFAVAESLRILPMPPPTPPMMHWVVQAMVFVVSALVIVYLLRNHRNKIEVVSKLSSDLARLKAQAELADTMRRSEELLDQTGELANVGGWELELPSRVLRRTAQFYRILDLVPEAAFRVEEAFNSISAAARPAIMTAFQQAVGKGTPFDLELPLTTAKGRRIWLRAIGRPQVEDHRVVRITGVLQDITTRKQEEDALRQAQQLLDSIVEHIPVMLFVKRADDLRFELFNRAGEAMLGYTRAELLGKNDHDLFPAAQADAFTAADREVLASTDVTEIAQEPVRIASGETRYLQTRKVALRDATGKASHLLGISIDVTARKQSERALQAAKAEADRANVAKSEFLSRMSHELRTPLNAILGFGQLLKLELQTGDQADNVREILRAGQHLLDLINEVLDLARIESGKFAVSLAPVSLATLVADCLTLVRPLAAARGIRLVEDGLHAAGGVVADRTRLKQVLLNLLSNAVKYNRENGEVRIDCVTDDDTTELRITDTGAGLSPEQQARLFVPFERLDANQTAVEGTGIGLALSKRLMENMQGQIGVHSTQGAGSTFWVRLPVADREAEASRAAPLAAPLPTGVHRAPYHRDVLCIEDNPANLRLVERILARRADIRLLSASAPAAGLELAQAHCPDLILLDINLPGMDGYAVMRSLRDNPITRHIPVVAISANAMPADLARGQAAGFVEYLTKPLEVERLMAVVDQLTSPPGIGLAQNMIPRHPSLASVWLAFATAMLLLAAASVWLVVEQDDKERTEATASITRELRLLALLVGSDLARGEHLKAGRLLGEWGTENPRIASLRLLSGDGLVVAEYLRSSPAASTLALDAPIGQFGTGTGKLMLSLDTSTLVERRKTLIMQLVLALAANAAVLVALGRFMLARSASPKSEQRPQALGLARADLLVETERRRAAEEERDRLASIMEATTDIVSMADPHGRIIYFNQAGRTMFGVVSDTVLAKMIRSVHPPWAAELVQREGVPTAIRNGVWSAETAVLSPGGQETPVSQVILSHKDAQGKLLYLSTIMRDISERKLAEKAMAENERRFHRFFGESPAGLAMFDREHRWIYCNPMLARINGLAADALLGLRPRDVFSGALAADVEAALERTLTTGESYFNRETSGLTPADPGVVHHWLYSQFPLHDVQGRINGVGTVVIDTTSQKRAEDALRLLNEELEDRVEQRTAQLQVAKTEAERANQAKSEFLSRMSHELRTPLNAILGFGQLLALDVREREQSESVREVLQAGQHLLDLINEVLDLARVESGKFTVSLESVPLAALVAECAMLMRPLAEARGIRIHELQCARTAQVLADRTRLKQVLLNLLSNAVKYNRPGGEVRIDCTHQGDTIEVRISDTGPGLSAQQQARLFMPFERLDADQSAIEGTGIGLALSKRLVEHMQGDIGVHSTPGTGSTFWVRLPRARGGANAHPEAQAPAALQGAAPHTPLRRDVLCIEDNPANLRLIERILGRRADIRLLSASAPGLGLELARSHRPALILLDINLPDMDGYAVMQCLRENAATRDIPVVAISANAMPADLARGREAGFTDYLTKPLEVASLLRAVNAALPDPEGMDPVI